MTMTEFLALLVAVSLAVVRSRADLVAENLLLRQQLAVLCRPTRKRPRLRSRDRLFWILARLVRSDWRRHLVLVRPETVVRWHRRGWKLFWRWRSCAPFGRPRLSSEVRELIARTAAENPRWASDLADALGTTRGLLETWIRRGRVRAHQRDEPRRRWVIWADAAELARLRGLRERSVADEARRRWTEPPAELAAEYHSPAKE